MSPILSVVAAGLLGTELTVPFTYLVSCLFSKSSDPMLWGVFVTVVVSIAISLKYNMFRIKSVQRIDSSSILISVAAVIFSFWIMFKTFHTGEGGQVFVGSGNVFDSSYFLGLMRSMSWGSNIPFGSPYLSGAPIFYHFLFIFFAALWEHLGVPLTLAVNVPSGLSFAALLVVIYYLPQVIANQKPIVGWLAVVLTITNSSLTFWQLVMQKGLSIALAQTIARFPAYPYMGPYDGSTISIYMTLNSYVNQRHLAFGIALVLLLWLLTVHILNTRKFRTSVAIVLGVASGMVFLWNMALFVLNGLAIASILSSQKRWRELIWFALAAGAATLVSILPISSYLLQAAVFINSNFVSGTPWLTQIPRWTITEYLWQNLGILPVVAVIGFFIYSRRARGFVMPFIVLFFLECIVAGMGHRGFDQKFLSLLVIPVNIMAASGVVWLWGKNTLWKTIATLIFFVLTVSGVVDLMPIKNAFAYPIVGNDSVRLITWIRNSTPKNAVFVSYSDMVDPVVLAGRTNFFGFFGNIGYFDRSAEVKKIYAGDIALARSQHVSYILVPKWQKNDFPYRPDISTLPVAYQDARYIVFAVK